MSLERLEQKIDSHIEHQGQRDDRIEDLLTGLVEQMTTFVGFQSRAEERHLADKEWRERIEKQQSGQDDGIKAAQKTADTALSQSQSNGRWINRGWAAATFVAGCIVTAIVNSQFGV